jgi:hypothetical protein
MASPFTLGHDPFSTNYRYGGGNWCYWCVNGSQSQAPGRDPSQPDWYGVLDPTWSGAASQPMMTKLRTIQ